MADPIDSVFRPEQSDFEMGDIYEKFGPGGVYDLVKHRNMLALVDSHGVAISVANAFCISPGDLTSEDYDSAAFVAYVMERE